MNNRDKLLQSHGSGNLIKTIQSLINRSDHNSLALELAALHNEGLVDVVEAFKSLKERVPNGPDFFQMRYIFQTALPDINAPVLSVMQCVLRLFQDAGHDIAAGMIFNSYIDFCHKEPSRPLEALTEIEADPDNLVDLLPKTLIAGFHIDSSSYLTQAIRFCEDANIELRRRAVFSFGGFNWPENVEISTTILAALECSATAETDDQILAGIVKSGFVLLRQFRNQEQQITKFVVTALSKGSDYTLHEASQVFRFQAGELAPTLVDVLLIHLMRVKPTNKGTLDNIDYGISHLLRNNDHEKVFRFLEDLLLAHPDGLTMEVFDSTAREILSNKTLMNKILTRWFMRGERVLCNSVEAIVEMHHGTDLSLEIDPAELTPSDFLHTVFVARKAVGYFFMQPISAATVLISLMRNAKDDAILIELGALLFDPLLLNFPGKLREYIIKQSVQESDKVKDAIERALKAINDYLEDLHSVGNLPALHPSTRQREAYQRYFSHHMSKAWKEAEVQSVFLNLVSKNVLLYGRKSIDYVSNADGEFHRMEIPLQSHDTTIEIPRMQHLDPFGLDYKLRVFRGEQLMA